jgi:hypothetical protein
MSTVHQAVKLGNLVFGSGASPRLPRHARSSRVGKLRENDRLEIEMTAYAP